MRVSSLWATLFLAAVGCGFAVADETAPSSNMATANMATVDTAGVEFFESRIRPLLIAKCYQCHSAETKSSGGLLLDTKAGWERGGDGGPAIVPGKPDDSRLMEAVLWKTDELRMPPKQQLTAAEIADLTEWVKRGSPDPRTEAPAAPSTAEDWESIYQRRLQWWSLQPIKPVSPPNVKQTDWPSGNVDRFILARLEQAGLSPAPDADRETLARRTAFTLTGLPPTTEQLSSFAADPSPDAFERYVDSLLASPHYGEHFARHWMDVVHYSDTHGYEWDVPAKNAWRYRDYLVRAYNADVPYRQLVLEQIAGDLLPEPRIHRDENIVESLIGPCSLRMGERRHGDNAEFEGVTQEWMDNVVDTVSKAYLATTVACAHCHDHKLDALSQRDYYAWSGVFHSTRWVSRTVDAVDPNTAAIERLKGLKSQLRPLIAARWLASLDMLPLRLTSVPDPANPPWKAVAENTAPPLEQIETAWRLLQAGAAKGEEFPGVWKRVAEQYTVNNAARKDNNAARCRLIADFRNGHPPEGWMVDGLGARTGFTVDGDFVVLTEGPDAVQHVLPAGMYTHLYSPRLQGAVRSPLLSLNEAWVHAEVVGGAFSHVRHIIDNSLFPEVSKPLNAVTPTWETPFVRMSDGHKHRRMYFEIVTKGLNNNWPPRIGLIEPSSPHEADDRSWFGVSQVQAQFGFLPEFAWHAKLFAGDPPATLSAAADRFTAAFRGSISRFGQNAADAEDARLINWLLHQRWLSNELETAPEVAALVDEYRRIEQSIRGDSIVGSVADLSEGRNERVGIRGSYFDLGPETPRGTVRFLEEHTPPVSSGCGRLELAHGIVSPQNPLTARVYVNRVWKWMFGVGLVRSMDDFGHLGEQPSHPELLDMLASEFMADGWSTKRLVRRLVTSRTWRQSGATTAAAREVDPENQLLHHRPLQRLEAESIRDAIVFVSGAFQPRLYGPGLDPHRIAVDPQKRLFNGPVDGGGRRSIYTKVTLMEPPKFLAEFNQPLPKLTTGSRDVTNVPSQALALLNDPFVVQQAEQWGGARLADGCTSPERRVEQMLRAALGRNPSTDEVARFAAFARKTAELRGVQDPGVMSSAEVWRDVAHAVFNLKEFLYVR